MKIDAVNQFCHHFFPFPSWACVFKTPDSFFYLFSFSRKRTSESQEHKVTSLISLLGFFLCFARTQQAWCWIRASASALLLSSSLFCWVSLLLLHLLPLSFQVLYCPIELTGFCKFSRIGFTFIKGLNFSCFCVQVQMVSLNLRLLLAGTYFRPRKVWFLSYPFMQNLFEWLIDHKIWFFDWNVVLEGVEVNVSCFNYGVLLYWIMEACWSFH